MQVSARRISFKPYLGARANPSLHGHTGDFRNSSNSVCTQAKEMQNLKGQMTKTKPVARTARRASGSSTAIEVSIFTIDSPSRPKWHNVTGGG